MISCFSHPRRHTKPCVSAIAAALFFLATGILGSGETVANDAPNIIFDTDFRADCDDVGALAVLHALADDGECDLLGIVTSTTGPSIVGAIDAVNTFFGRPNLPIGLSPVPHTEHFDPFAPALADLKRYPSDQTNKEAPNAIALYRRLLHDAPDKSVKIVVVGYATCPALLLKTKANHDGDSIPFSGLELVQQKVIEMVQMAGVRPGGSDTFNLGHDASAAVYVEDHWPTKIVYSNQGKNIKAGAALQHPEINPVAKAFELYPGAGPRGTIGNRQCWDEIATLHAVRGGTWGGKTWWKESPPCEMSMTVRHIKNPQNKEKDTAVDVQISESNSGNRTYLIQVADKQKTARMIEALMTRCSHPKKPSLSSNPAPHNLQPAFSVVERAVETGVIPGAAVLVMQDGRVVARRSFGVRDVDSNLPFRENTICWIASLTKPVTAAAAMTLVDQGKLDLDIPVDHYLPSFSRLQSSSGIAHSITTRQLLCHSSGIASKVPLRPRFFFDQSWFDQSLNDVTNAIAQQPLAFAPGQTAQYSNAAPYVTGRIIEIQSGSPFAEMVDQRILSPIGMTDTGFEVPQDNLNRVATVYRREKDKLVTYCRYDAEWDIQMAMPDGGLFSTPYDIALFANEFLRQEPQVLSPNSVDQMLTQQSDGYGLGWIIDSDLQFSHWGSSGTLVWGDRTSGVVGVLFSQVQDRARIAPIQNQFRNEVDRAFRLR